MNDLDLDFQCADRRLNAVRHRHDALSESANLMASQILRPARRQYLRGGSDNLTAIYQVRFHGGAGGAFIGGASGNSFLAKPLTVHDLVFAVALASDVDDERLVVRSAVLLNPHALTALQITESSA